MNVFVGVGNVCATMGDGFFPDPDNCDVFIHCSNGQANTQVCAPSSEGRPLTFNPETNRCDYVDSVPCSKAQYATVAPIKGVTSPYVYGRNTN